MGTGHYFPSRSWQIPDAVLCLLFWFLDGKQSQAPFEFTLSDIPQVGPIISGPMAQQLGWRSFWWLNTALLGFVAICCIFLFPETKFNRSFMPQNSMVSSSPRMKEGSAEQIDTPAQNHSESSAMDHADPEKTAPVQPQTSGVVEDAGLSHVHTHDDPWLGRGRQSKAQWRFAQPY